MRIEKKLVRIFNDWIRAIPKHWYKYCCKWWAYGGQRSQTSIYCITTHKYESEIRETVGVKLNLRHIIMCVRHCRMDWKQKRFHLLRCVDSNIDFGQLIQRVTLMVWLTETADSVHWRDVMTHIIKIFIISVC